MAVELAKVQIDQHLQIQLLLNIKLLNPLTQIPHLGVILFDDFLMRPHYHIVLDYFTIVDQTADKCMVVLKKKAGASPSQELIERYEIIAE